MIWIIIIGQASISAVLCGVIADSKNRDVAGWAVLGFLFGLFALIAAVGVAPVPEEAKSEEAKPNESKRLDPVSFAGERDLANDAYRLWLADHYDVRRNEVFESFVIGDRMFPDLEQALTYAHSEDVEAVAAAEAAAVARAEAEEREQQLRQQRMAQAAAQAVEERRKFWRKDFWIILAGALVVCAGFATYLRYQLQDIEQQELAKRSAVIERRLSPLDT